MRIALFFLTFPFLIPAANAEEKPGAPAAHAEKGTSEARLTLGADYAAGEIDGLDYETRSVSGGLALRSGRLFLSASLPYVITTAPEELIVSQGGLFGTPFLAQPSTRTEKVRREGLGDVQLQAGYSIPLGGVDALVAASAKLPTASREKGLGTGEFDYALSGQVSKRMGAVIPFVNVGYTIIGEPEGFNLRNTLAGTAGSQFLLGRGSALSLSFSYEQSASEGIEDRQSIGVSFGKSLAPKLHLNIDGAAGVSADAPDARLGVRLGIGF